MKILITGHHLELGESLKTYINTEVAAVCTKYFDHPISATVNITKEKTHFMVASIQVNEGVGNGVMIISDASDSDPYKAFDFALAKVDKQLSKYKERLKRHRKDKDALNLEANKFILSPHADKHNHEEDVPVIVAETSTSIEKLTVADAVMKMDLLDVPALLFINRGSGRLNMVYYRRDGNISWVDAPKLTA